MSECEQSWENENQEEEAMTILLYDAASAATSVSGLVIIGSVEDTSSPDGFWGLRLQNKRTKEEFILWVLRDEEGNGPGCLEVVPIENKDE